jgi:hypothetical protein
MPHSVAETTNFLDQCQPALRHLYAVLTPTLQIQDALQRQIAKTRDQYDWYQANLSDTSDWSETAKFYYSRYTAGMEGTRRELESLSDPARLDEARGAAIARLSATEESIGVVAGAVLQIAKQVLSFRYGAKPTHLSAARPVGSQSVVNVIWEGRNHALHWEDPNPHTPVREMLEKLRLEAGAPVVVGANNSHAILDALQWKDVDAVVRDLQALLAGP